LMSGNIFSGGAFMLAARATLKVLGLVAAKPKSAANTITTTIATIVNIDVS